MTLSELKTAVLLELGVLATGESPVAGDAQIVSDKYTALHKMLVSEGLVSWGIAEDIPENAEEPIVAMVSHLCAKPFGVPQARRVELEQAGAFNLATNKGGPSTAERQLRRQLADPFVYAPIATEFF